MDLDFIIEDLKIQASICDLTGDEKRIKSIEKAIDLLEKESNVYKLPKMMTFQQIHHIPRPVVSSVNIPAGGTVTAKIYGIGNPSPPVQPVPIPNAYPGCAPSPTPVSAAINPSAFFNPNDNPKPGHEIFGIWTDANGMHRYCIYTWQEYDNPEELHAYAVGWDAYDQMAGCEKWMPCKKVQHDKFLVVCQSECCPQKK